MACLLEDDASPSIEPISEDDLQEAIMMDAENRSSMSNFALVIFDRIPKTYPINTDIECNFILTHDLQPSTNDWIGLYRVGWHSSRTYYTYNYVPLLTKNPSIKNVKGSVTFLAAYLPKDDSEFYQFCYVAHSDHIRGASTPFQFKKTYVDDYVELEDKNEELMIVQSKAALMEDQLKAFADEQIHLQKSKLKLQIERDLLHKQYEHITKELEKEREQSEAQCKTMQEYKHEIDVAQQRAKSMKDENDHLVHTISSLSSSKESMEQIFMQRVQEMDVMQKDIKKLIDEKNVLSGQMKTREGDVALLKSNLHDSELKFKLTVSNLEARLLNEKANSNTLQETFKMLQDEILDLKNMHEKEQKESKDLIARLQQNLTLMESQCKASEKCQEMLTDELKAYSALREKLTVDIETSEGEAHSLKLQLSKLEEKHQKDFASFEQESNLLRAEILELKKENERLKENLNKKHQELESLQGEHLIEKENGAQFALKQALTTLQKRYNHLKKQLSMMTEKQKLADQKESTFQHEISDLKERLNKGAKEWKIKYLECQSLKKLLSQNMQISSSSRESSYARDQTNDDEFVECEEESLIVVHKFPETFHESASAKSSVSSCNSRTMGLPETDQVLRQSKDLREVLSSCMSKKEKYKTLYKEVQEKCAALNCQLAEKEQRIQNELKLQDNLRQDLKAEFQHKLQNLKGFIEDRDVEMAELRENLQRLRILQEDSLPVTISQKPSPPSRISYSSTFPTIYGNPYANEVSITLPLPPKHVVTNDYTDVASSSDEAASGDNLPPPLQATVLPSAKIAAITAVSRQMSPASVSVTVDNSELDEVFTDGDNDADRSSSVSPRASISRSSSFLISNSETSFELAPEDVEPTFQLCPVCATRFSTNTPFAIFEDHVYTHYGPICPMCNVQFSTDFTHGDFLRHVHGHFED